jgi:preprotein translocase subunit SecG
MSKEKKQKLLDSQTNDGVIYKNTSTVRTCTFFMTVFTLMFAIIFIMLAVALSYKSNDLIFQGHVDNMISVTVSEYAVKDCKNGNVYVVGQVNDESMYFQTCNINNACLDSNTIQSDFSIETKVNVYFAGTGQGCYMVDDYDKAILKYSMLQTWHCVIGTYLLIIACSMIFCTK